MIWWRSSDEPAGGVSGRGSLRVCVAGKMALGLSPMIVLSRCRTCLAVPTNNPQTVWGFRERRIVKSMQATVHLQNIRQLGNYVWIHALWSIGCPREARSRLGDACAPADGDVAFLSLVEGYLDNVCIFRACVYSDRAVTLRVAELTFQSPLPYRPYGRFPG